jgi:hypothetical protein
MHGENKYIKTLFENLYSAVWREWGRRFSRPVGRVEKRKREIVKQMEGTIMNEKLEIGMV